MINRAGRIGITLTGLFLSTLPAGCGVTPVDEGSTGALSQEATTCDPVFARFPVDARHNIGYGDGQCTVQYCNLFCPPTAQTVANNDYHGGIDIFADPGAPVVAAQAGTIVVGFTDQLGGNVVYVKDACGWNHYYAHLATVDAALSLGKAVSVGTPLGTVGNTGNASGTQHHLHYGLYNDVWTPSDPFAKLAAIEWYSCTPSWPDLSPTAITFSPNPILPGNAVTFDSGVRNGGATATGSFNVKWFVDGVQVGYGGHAGVPANTTVLNGNSAYLWTATAGTHTISFRVDVDNGVAETNEGNNATSITVTVTPRADLQPTAITYNGASLVRGANVLFDSGVRNNTAVGTGSFNVKWFVDNVQVGYGGHTGVPGNTTVLNGNSAYTWKAVAGTHTIRFNVDVDNGVAETNEANNSTQVTVAVP